MERPQRTQSLQGKGLAVLRAHPSVSARPFDQASAGLTATFTHLASSFPLKLISPRASSRNASRQVRRSRTTTTSAEQDRRNSREESGLEAAFSRGVAALYIVGYGGGLVSGDDVQLDVDVGEQCTLAVLTQGSTKVFKVKKTAPIEVTRSPPMVTSLATRQKSRFLIRPNACLVVLPDPVTCYEASHYTQIQRFDLQCASTSSLVLLDWITPGRQLSATGKTAAEDDSSSSKGKPAGEAWRFKCYRSRNEIRLPEPAGVLVRDVLELAGPPESLSGRTRPYQVYGTLFLVGPAALEALATFQAEWLSIEQRKKAGSSAYQVRKPAMDYHSWTDPNVLWSFSLLEISKGSAVAPGPSSLTQPQAAIVRFAGTETDTVRTWLRSRLGSLKDQSLGPDLFRSALG